MRKGRPLSRPSSRWIIAVKARSRSPSQIRACPVLLWKAEVAASRQQGKLKLFLARERPGVPLSKRTVAHIDGT